MVGFGLSDQMIGMSGKENKQNTYYGFSSTISFFTIASKKVMPFSLVQE